MKEAKVENMELGNLLFGNSRGKYSVEPRMEYQDLFFRFLERNGFDGYGVKDGHYDLWENDTFSVRPYYWGEDEDVAELPNFVYKPTGLEISWYKYPMRDAYSNQDITTDEFVRILDNCQRSMGAV